MTEASAKNGNAACGEQSRTIKNWPTEDRPREKLFKRGSYNLEDTELLAILLRTGTRGQSAIDLARKIKKKFETFREMSTADTSQWREIKGLGPAKIAQLKAALEIGRRFREVEIRKERPRVKSAEDAVNIVKDLLKFRLRDLKKEVFWVILLDSQGRLIKDLEIIEGTVNQANPIIREVFEKALQEKAASIICVHNHPSGSPKPSNEDRRFTMDLVHAGDVLQVKVLDHIIIGDGQYFSFAEEGEIG